MKKLVICSMMCLATMATKAQVMTSATINKVYEQSIVESGKKFAYNADRDEAGNITTMYVYKKKNMRRGDVSLEPVCRYEYDYAVDGMLNSRITSVWNDGEWHLLGRYDFNLMADMYSVEYSRWNATSGDFDKAVEKMTYTLLPDDSVNHISCYQRDDEGKPYQLAWEVEVTELPFYMNGFLTQR